MSASSANHALNQFDIRLTFNYRARYPALANHSSVEFILGTSSCSGITTDAEGKSSFSEHLSRRLQGDSTDVIVTPVLSGPRGDPSAHFALAIINQTPDVVYIYDSLENSSLPEKILQCVRNTAASSTTTAKDIGVDEKQRGAWECAYLVIRRQFVTLLVLLTLLSECDISHPFSVTDEWVQDVLVAFHENVALEWIHAESTQATAIYKFVNTTLLPVFLKCVD